MTFDDPFADCTLPGRYDDGRKFKVEPSHNYEVAVRIGNQGPIWLDGVDLLRLVSHVVLDMLYGPSPTEDDRRGAELARLKAIERLDGVESDAPLTEERVREIALAHEASAYRAIHELGRRVAKLEYAHTRRNMEEENA